MKRWHTLTDAQREKLTSEKLTRIFWSEHRSWSQELTAASPRRDATSGNFSRTKVYREIAAYSRAARVREQMSIDPSAISIEDLPFRTRVLNCLMNAGIQTIGQLIATPSSSLLRYRNFGPKCLEEIQALLQQMGLPQLKS